MSNQVLRRFADPKRLRPVPLGPCRCDGAPHPEGDEAWVRAEIGDGELRRATSAGWDVNDGRWYNGAVGDTAAAAIFTQRWNLLDEGGQPLAVTEENIDLLDEASRDAIVDAVIEAVNARGPLPNQPAASSAASSPGSASPTRTTRRRS